MHLPTPLKINPRHPALDHGDLQHVLACRALAEQRSTSWQAALARLDAMDRAGCSLDAYLAAAERAHMINGRLPR
jgi:hypothetical protein